MLRSRQIWEIPTETSRIAHNSLPKGNEYLTLRDNIGVIYQSLKLACNVLCTCFMLTMNEFKFSAW